MLRRMVLVLSLVALVIAGGMSVGCSEAKQGQLPTYEVGDTWTYEESYEGSYYSVTFEVTGESRVDGRDCWTIRQTYDPAFMGIGSSTVKCDKANLFPLLGQASGSMLGVPFTLSVKYTYQPADASYYPLEVGMEVSVEETSETTYTSLGETETESETVTHHYKVEAVEEVKVEAGTFKCFKITDGDATIWYSDKVKQDVKRIEEDGTVQELTSYSS